MLLEDWPASVPELLIGSEVTDRTNRFTDLWSFISPNELVCDVISARIQRGRLAFPACFTPGVGE